MSPNRRFSAANKKCFLAFCWFLCSCFHLVLFAFVRMLDLEDFSLKSANFLRSQTRCKFSFKIHGFEVWKIAQRSPSAGQTSWYFHFFPNKCKALTNGHQNEALEMPQMQPLSSGKSLSDIKLLQMTLKKVHRCSYIPQKKSGSKPVSFNDSGVLGAWKTSATSKHFVSSERFWNGSVWHKLPEEAWDKFRRLNKVPDKFLQYAAIVVGNHLTCLFCVFLVFLKFCLLAVLFRWPNRILFW